MAARPPVVGPLPDDDEDVALTTTRAAGNVAPPLATTESMATVRTTRSTAAVAATSAPAAVTSSSAATATAARVTTSSPTAVRTSTTANVAPGVAQTSNTNWHGWEGTRVAPDGATLASTGFRSATMDAGNNSSSDASYLEKGGKSVVPIAVGVVAGVLALLLLLVLRMLYRRKQVRDEERRLAKQYAKNTDTFEGGHYENEKQNDIIDMQSPLVKDAPHARGTPPTAAFTTFPNQSAISVRTVDSSAPLFPGEDGRMPDSLTRPQSPAAGAFPQSPVQGGPPAGLGINTHLVASPVSYTPGRFSPEPPYQASPRGRSSPRLPSPLAAEFPAHVQSLENPFTSTGQVDQGYTSVQSSAVNSRAPSPIEPAFAREVANVSQSNARERSNSAQSGNVSYGLAMEPPTSAGLSRSASPLLAPPHTISSSKQPIVNPSLSKSAPARTPQHNNAPLSPPPQLEAKRASNTDWSSFMDTMMNDEDDDQQKR